MKIIAKINLKKNVEIELSQISFDVTDLLPDSSEMWIPKPSESASATAITRIPLMITAFDSVDEYNPMIKPRVVIIPDVNPNPNPFLIESFIEGEGKIVYKITSRYHSKINLLLVWIQP